jgi:hypothetical protein
MAHRKQTHKGKAWSKAHMSRRIRRILNECDVIPSRKSMSFYARINYGDGLAKNDV